jgi:hypothetical protein
MNMKMMTTNFLYYELANIDKMPTSLLSVLAKGNCLYQAHLEDGKVIFRCEKFDTPITQAQNVPMSEDIVLDVVPGILERYTVRASQGNYSFELLNENCGMLEHIRSYDLGKDCFMAFNLLVHVQDYDASKEEKVMEGLLKNFPKFETPEKFLDHLESKLSSEMGDIEKIMSELDFTDLAVTSPADSNAVAVSQAEPMSTPEVEMPLQAAAVSQAELMSTPEVEMHIDDFVELPADDQAAAVAPADL